MNNYHVFAEMARPVLLKYLSKASLNAEEKKYVDILANWNLNADINEKGATVFNAIWDSTEAAIYKDEFAAAKLNLGWPDDPILLESLLRDSAYTFIDNIGTSNKMETIDDVVLEGLKKAVTKLAALEKENKLEWGKFKDTKVVHWLKIPALSRMHLPIGGGRHMINATTEDHGPSWRMIVHLTDEIEAYCVYPGGQNGNPGSKYYDTFIDSWANGKYYQILFLKKEDAPKHKKVKWLMTFTQA
jgi:penicillin amidase